MLFLFIKFCLKNVYLIKTSLTQIKHSNNIGLIFIKSIHLLDEHDLETICDSCFQKHNIEEFEVEWFLNFAYKVGSCKNCSQEVRISFNPHGSSGHH